MAESETVTFTNTAAGPRGVHGINGLVLIEAGKSADVEVTEAEFLSAMSTSYFAVAKPDPLDHDGDGKPGGSEPHDPPALSGLNKKQLLEIAAAEGVETEDGATNAAITAAIEAKRAAAAE